MINKPDRRSPGATSDRRRDRQRIRSCNSVNSDLERIVARTTTPEPLGVLAAALAELTRDVTTSQPRTVSLSYFARTARRFQSADGTRRRSGQR